MHKDMKTIDELKQEVAATGLPEKTKELFYKVLDTAEVATLSEQDRIRYESEWKGYLDTMSCIDRAEEKGFEKGIEKGVLSVAKSMKDNGLDASVISKCTNLSVEVIKNL